MADPGNSEEVRSCRLFGHRPQFRAVGASMHWECARGCGAHGEKRYRSAEDAARYAAAFNREDRGDVGRRPLLSLLPLGWARGRRGGRSR
ncbi:MAG: hypothetical protein WB771_15265, partial [Solirubrobacterales bacterium]